VSNWSVKSEPEELTLEERAGARLRALVRAGTLKPGDQLPAEPELARRLGISRPTLRAAVSELVASRLLVRQRGVGTFVSTSPPHLSQGLEHLMSTGASISMLGREPGTASLRVRRESADADVAERLQVLVGDSVVHISRTRTADGSPVLHCEEWISTDLLPDVGALDEFGADDSLYDTLASFGLVMRDALTRFIPLNPEPELCRHLDMSPGSPVLLLEQQHFLESVVDCVGLFSRNYYNCDLIDLHVVRRN